MSRFVAVMLVGIAIAAAFVGPAMPQGSLNGNTLYLGCKALAEGRPDEPMRQTACATAVAVVMTIHRSPGVINQAFMICPPEGSNVFQAIKIVTKYMDDHPDQMQHDISGIAFFALQAAWRCPN